MDDTALGNKGFRKLAGNLNSRDRAEFENQFRDLFSSSEARHAKGVVYAWVTQKPIPRLRGESNIVYIGRTEQTLSDRQRKYAKRENSDYNWARYEFIIPQFGAITVMYADAAAIAKTSEKEPEKAAEAALLNLYFKDHLEYPPLNEIGIAKDFG